MVERRHRSTRGMSFPHAIDAAILWASAAAAVEPPRWRVVSVHEGDTVRCLDAGNREHKVRLSGIDAPETGQPFGTVSRDHLRQLVLRRHVVVHDVGQDKYRRMLARA